MSGGRPADTSGHLNGPTPALVLLALSTVGCDDGTDYQAEIDALSAEMQTNVTENTTLSAENAARAAEIDAINGAVDLSALDASVPDHETRLVAVEGDELVAADLDGLAREDWLANQGLASAADVFDKIGSRYNTASGDHSSIYGDSDLTATDDYRYEP